MPEAPLTKIWVTRWALTGGIIQADAKLYEGKAMASYVPEGSFGSVFVHGDDFHLTEELAIQHAYIMRAKKIQSLNKQLEKIQKLSFMKTE